MSTDALQEEVRLDLEKMSQVVGELGSLADDVRGRKATLRETAAGAFLAQFYMGVENILKRIAQHYGVDVPRSASWHVDLFNRFCASSEGVLPARGELPVLFSEELAAAVKPYRRFRHVIHHAYGVDLEWSRMEAGISQVGEVFGTFRKRVLRYLDHLG